MRENARKYRKNSFKGAVAEFFKMKNDRYETFMIEVCGGVTMYFVGVYILSFNQFLQGLYLSSLAVVSIVFNPTIADE